jgi:hypothetical protein
VSRRFLGLEKMSRDDQLRVGLVGIILLSLECVLAGLVTDAPVRGWIIHALAAGLGAWALSDMGDALTRAAGAAGVTAVANEALMIAEANQSMKYLLPGSLLLVVSLVVIQRTLDRPPATQVIPVGAPFESDRVPLLPSVVVDESKNRLAVGVGVVGALMTLYGLVEAEWILVRALFGLIRERLALADLQVAWQDLGAPSAVGEFVIVGAQYTGYLGVVIVAAAVLGAVSRPIKLSRGARSVLASALGVSAICNLMVVAALLSASSNVVVLGGAWLAPIGLGLATYSFWVTTSPA